MDQFIIRRYHSVGVHRKRHKLCLATVNRAGMQGREGARLWSIVREVSSFIYVADTCDLASCSTLSSLLPLIITLHHSSPDTDARVWQRPRADPVDFWHHGTQKARSNHHVQSVFDRSIGQAAFFVNIVAFERGQIPLAATSQLRGCVV